MRARHPKVLVDHVSCLCLERTDRPSEPSALRSGSFSGSSSSVGFFLQRCGGDPLIERIDILGVMQELWVEGTWLGIRVTTLEHRA